VLVSRDLDGLKIACSGSICQFPHGHGALLWGHPCHFVVFAAEDGEVAGPPWFGVVGRP